MGIVLNRVGKPRFRSDEFVDEVFEEFLAAAADEGFAVFEGVGFEFFEAGAAAFNLGTDAVIEAAVALLDEAIEAAVVDDGLGDFEAASEGVHAADVGVEEIDWLEAFAPDFGIEVQTTSGEAAVL